MRISKSLFVLMVIFGATSAWAGKVPKVTICHIPPGNPANWHTITVGARAVPAHLANHGDLIDSCSANCDALCDDGNPCTQDVEFADEATGECVCMETPPPVDCDDGSLCTADSCDPDAGGCINTMIDCGDGNDCTVDVCNPATGSCENPTVDCGDGEVCDPDLGSCVDPCDGIMCEPLDQCHQAGACSFGECDDGLPVDDGTDCDDGDPTTSNDACSSGICVGETPPPAACPCIEGLPGMSGWTAADSCNASPSDVPSPTSITLSAGASLWGVGGGQCQVIDLPLYIGMYPLTAAEEAACAELLRSAFGPDDCASGG